MTDLNQSDNYKHPRMEITQDDVNSENFTPPFKRYNPPHHHRPDVYYDVPYQGDSAHFSSPLQQTNGDQSNSENSLEQLKTGAQKPTTSSLVDTSNVPLDYASFLTSEQKEQLLNKQSLEEKPLDTTDVAQRVLAKLDELGIVQTEFAEKVLSRTQGTFSDLLHYPKPWEKIKSKGREVYRRMEAWLDAPDKIKKAIEFCSVEETEMLLSLPPGKSYKHKKIVEMAPSLPKRKRTVFDAHQKCVLNEIYEQTSRPNQELMMQIASTLDLNIKTVRFFFKNKRSSGKTKQN